MNNRKEFQRVFLVGAPRSGTSWLQTMLGAHPEVASPPELHLFDNYLRPWQQSWEAQVDPPPGEDWIGPGELAWVLTQAEFEALITHVVDTIHRQVVDSKPSATVLLAKTPDYSLYVDDIIRYVPESRFIHLIRDGRDVVASLLAASKGWGKPFWGGESIERAATRWKSHVLGAQLARDRGSPYLELRYEDLLGDSGPRLLREAFAFCGLDAPDDLCSSIYERHQFDRMRVEGHSSLVRRGELARVGRRFEAPQGFFRQGTGGEWRDWSARTCWRFDQAAGRLLRDLGYADQEWTEVGQIRHRLYLTVRRAARTRKLMKAVARRAANRAFR